MDKRYQVFISSTYEDLKEERQEVIQALLELDCIPAGMELFPAADDDQWTLIKKIIDDCDYYLVIVGGRYGSVSDSGISYTQMEYEYAIERGKPVIGFIHSNPGEISAAKTERTDDGKTKLEEFRNLVKRKMCKSWATPSELGSVVSRSLVQLIKNKPAVGWVKADLVPNESASREILKLRNKIIELEGKLENIQSEPPEGSDLLSNGDDVIEVRFEALIGIGNSEESLGSSSIAEICLLTWNEIFYAIAPRMIWEESSEDTVKSRIENLIEEKESERIKEEHSVKGYGTIIIQTTLNQMDYDTIIIQLWALGYLKKSNRPNHWTLTPYGLRSMIESRAIKKGEKLSADDSDIPL